MIPGYAGGTELIQNRPKLVHKLQAVVSNNSYFSGCYDGTLNAGFVLYRRNVLLKTCRAARGLVWRSWRGDVERTGRERAEEILNKREEHWMRQGTWDEDGKREILGILDRLVGGEIFSYDPCRMERTGSLRPEIPEGLRQIPPELR